MAECITCIKDGKTGVCRDIKDKKSRELISTLENKLNEIIDTVNTLSGVDGGHLATDKDLANVLAQLTALQDDMVTADTDLQEQINLIKQDIEALKEAVFGPTFDPVFANNTPAQIDAISNEIAKNGYTSTQVYEKYGWSIGDSKPITLTTGEVIEMRIIGYNHDDKADGTGKAGLTLEMVNILTTKYPMNTTSSNVGGYPASAFRNTTIPLIKATLPEEWQDVIKTVNKKSANGGGNNYSETITHSEDLFLLSEYEVFGDVVNAQNGENEGPRYEYYVSNDNDSSRLKLHDTDLDGTPETAIQWVLRSCLASNWQYNEKSYCYVNSTGGHSYMNGSSFDTTISFAFCV